VECPFFKFSFLLYINYGYFEWLLQNAGLYFLYQNLLGQYFQGGLDSSRTVARNSSIRGLCACAGRLYFLAGGLDIKN